MIDKTQSVGQVRGVSAVEPVKPVRPSDVPRNAFGAMLQKQLDEKAQGAQAVNFSKHALERAEQRGIELTPALMDQLADSVERAQEKGATNILAFDDSRAFIINIPYGRVITTLSQEDMRENIFTNIDGAVRL